MQYLINHNENERAMKDNETEEGVEINDQSPELIRRDFLKKFGKYAATTPIVAFTLMSSQTSAQTDSNSPA